MGLFLLDLDGTLVDDALIEIDGKLQRPQHRLFHEPVLLPGVFDRLHQAALEGDSFAIVTNQGGVAWGYHTVAEVYARIGRALALLQYFWARPFSVHVAFKMEKGNLLPQFKGDDGRKPAANMLLAAMSNAIGLSGGPCEPGAFVAGALPVMVGDRDEDREAAAAAGVDFVLAGDFFGW